MDRRTLSQASLELLDFRVKQLEDERMPHRMQAAETMMKQLQHDVQAIARETKEFGDRLDDAVQQLGSNQLRFITIMRTGLWISGTVGALIAGTLAYAPTIQRVLAAISQ